MAGSESRLRSTVGSFLARMLYARDENAAWSQPWSRKVAFIGSVGCASASPKRASKWPTFEAAKSAILFAGPTASKSELSDFGQNSEEADDSSSPQSITLLDLAPVGIFRIDTQGRCTYANRLCRELLGLPDKTWEGDGWARNIHPDDRQRVLNLCSTAQTGEVEHAEEARVHRPDSTKLWCSIKFGTETDQRMAVSGYIGAISDITEKVEAKLELAERGQQLALLADNATDAVVRLDLQGRCNYASPSSSRILKIDASLLAGRKLFSWVHPEDANSVAKGFERLTSGNEDHVRMAFRHNSVTASAEYNWLEASCGTVRDELSGEPVEVIASLRNIDETKKLEEALIEARDASLRAAESKTLFLANMSHEIRTPMNGLLGFTDRALATAPDETFRRNLEKVAESGKMMLSLLNNFLDSAKIESGHMQIVSEPTDLRGIVNSVAILMEPARSNGSLPIHIEVDDEVPAWFLSDPLRVRQILLNLVGNALKFTQEGEINIRAVVDRNNSILEVSVSDTGIGISEEQLERIFDDFVQAEATIARRFGGTGLGLSISMQLARMLGGSLSAQSSLGEGSTFLLKLPFFACEKPSEAEHIRRTSVAPIEFSDRRVLVAEDNDINQELISEILDDAGIAYEVVDDGLQAVQRALEAQSEGKGFDLVLMDIRMPVLDGLGAAQKLREAGIDGENLPIIALTAHAYDDDIAACLDAGMQAHMAKPFEAEALVALMAEQLTNRKQTERASIKPRQRRRASLRQKYVDRKRAVHGLLLTISRDEQCSPSKLDELSSQLHQLGGVAGLFGEEEFGRICLGLEKTIEDGGDPTTDSAFTTLIDLLGEHDIAV